MDELKKYTDYNQALYRDNSFSAVVPSAGLICKKRFPKFIYPYRQRNTVCNIEPDECLKLLTLFGPSAPSFVYGFSQSPSHPAILNKLGDRYMYNLSINRTLQTPYSPNVDAFSDTYKKYRKLEGKTKRKVNIALDRLNSSLGTVSMVDQALELGIALENMLLSGKDEDGVSGEITYRLAHRGACFLGDTTDKRRNIFNILKSAYKLRSLAAHTGEVAAMTKKVSKGKGPMPTTYLLQDASKLCAEAIHKVILDGDFPDWTELIFSK